MQDDKNNLRGTDGGTPPEKHRERDGKPKNPERYAGVSQPEKDSEIIENPRVSEKSFVLCIYGVGFTLDPILTLGEKMGLDTKGKAPTSEVIMQTKLGYELEKRQNVKSVDEFFRALENGKEKFSRVVFIDHGASGMIAVKGVIHKDTIVKIRDLKGKIIEGEMDNVEFTLDGIINKRTLDVFSKNKIRAQQIRSRLDQDAVFDICACYVGKDKEFLQAFANLLDRTVRALVGRIIWNWSYRETQFTKDKKKICYPTGLITYKEYDKNGVEIESKGYAGKNGLGSTVKELFENVPLVVVQPQPQKQK